MSRRVLAVGGALGPPDQGGSREWSFEIWTAGGDTLRVNFYRSDRDNDLEFEIPSYTLREIVAERVRSQRIARLEAMSEDELLYGDDSHRIINAVQDELDARERSAETEDIES